MFNKLRFTALFQMMILVVICSAGYASTEKSGLLIPIGRFLQNTNNSLQLTINSKPFAPGIIEDGYGGFWLKIPFDEIQKKDKVEITFTKTNSDTRFYEENINRPNFLAPSPLVDCDNPDIVNKAKELIQGCSCNNEKAKKVFDYVLNNIKFHDYPGMHYTTASATLKKGYGICVNHSRLFVALCRAVGVPARTITGTNTNEQDLYFHHEWVEFYDDNKYWHILEPTFSSDFNFVDLRRIDLIYDIESNALYSFARGWGMNSVSLDNGNVSIFCPNWNLQERTGQMSYIMLNDKYPDSIEVKVDYDMSKFLY